MKLHWGHSIFIFYTFFVATLVVVVIKSKRFDNSLVTEAYYERDINYQSEYDRRMNSQQLSSPLKIVKGEGVFKLQFPVRTAISGTVLLYRPSSKKDDRLAVLQVEADGTMELNTNKMRPGRYTAVVEWSHAGIEYYDELNITL